MPRQSPGAAGPPYAAAAGWRGRVLQSARGGGTGDSSQWPCLCDPVPTHWAIGIRTERWFWECSGHEGRVTECSTAWGLGPNLSPPSAEQATGCSCFQPLHCLWFPECIQLQLTPLQLLDRSSVARRSKAISPKVTPSSELQRRKTEG